MEAITMEHKDLPFAPTSAAKEALSTASGTKMPIKCFGCDGLAACDHQKHHLWQNCPNKNDGAAWNNFNVNLKKFREERQSRHQGNQDTCRPNQKQGRTMLNWE
jgi:hypothetical protein